MADSLRSEAMEPLFRISCEPPLGTNFGYFIPADDAYERVKVCDGDCPFGAYGLIRRDPYRVEWTGGPIGDFCSAIGHMVARVEVCQELEDRFDGFECRPIEVVEPKGPRGQKLQQLFREICPLVHHDEAPERSTLLIKNRCERCGRKRTTLEGVEMLPSEEKIGDRWYPTPRKPRSPGMGVLLTSDEMQGAQIVRAGFLLCTQPVRDWIIERGFSNVSFLEYGEIIEGP